MAKGQYGLFLGLDLGTESVRAVAVDRCPGVLASATQVHPAKNSPALGAAILGAIVAGESGGGFDNPHEAVQAMAGRKSLLGAARIVTPNAEWENAYDACCSRYRHAAAAAR